MLRRVYDGGCHVKDPACQTDQQFPTGVRDLPCVVLQIQRKILHRILCPRRKRRDAGRNPRRNLVHYMASGLHQTVRACRFKAFLKPLHPPGGCCYKLAFCLCQTLCECPEQLRQIVLQCFKASAQGLALGFHGIVIAPALFRCFFQSGCQEVVCNGHALDFLCRFAGVVCQNAVNINACHCKLLDIYRSRLAHVFDLLQVSGHAGQHLAAAASSRNCIAQRQNCAASLASAHACADKQLICLNQRINVQRGECCILFDLVQNGLCLFCAAQHISEAGGVLFHLLVESNTLIHDAFTEGRNFFCKAYDGRCQQLRLDERTCQGFANTGKSRVEFTGQS